jgi:hypothetical protein
VISRYIAQQLTFFLKRHVPAFKAWKRPALEGSIVSIAHIHALVSADSFA